MIHGDSPYMRETYRYTPLLALLLAPNEWIHPAFGKVLFSAADILAGVLIRRILLDTVLPSIPANDAPPAKDPTKPMLQLPRTPPKSDYERRRERTATLLSAIHLLNPLVFAISTRGSSESLLLLLVLLALRSTTRARWTSAAVWLGIGTL
jgi:phosphatidylinositol glycan class M